MSKIITGVAIVVVIALAGWAYVAYLMPSNSEPVTQTTASPNNNTVSSTGNNNNNQSQATAADQAAATGNPDDIINQAVSGGTQEQALVKQSDTDLSGTSIDNQTINDFSGAYNDTEVK